MTTASWFTGDKDGLERIARRRGLAYVLFELVQNAWDTGAKNVDVTFTPVAGRPLVNVHVEDDDPDGFSDLTHAWTLFAESTKKTDATKRGRFNLGEKLVLAICEHATIQTTKGTVTFDKAGRRTSKLRSHVGTLFDGSVRMTREELAEVRDAAELLIVPPHITTTIDGRVLKPREPLATFEATLKTEIADELGFLKPTFRKTLIVAYRPLPDEPGRIYEMGIPVCETGDPWDLDVQMKVPVSLERNSVTASYLRELRTFTANAMRDYITPSNAATPAIQEAISQPNADPETVKAALTHMFGPKFVIADPSDREAENRCKADGYAIIHGRSLPAGAFENVRRNGVALPAGQVSPTPKPYSPDGTPAKYLPEEEWTTSMRIIAQYAHNLADRLIGVDLEVRFEVERRSAPWIANYGGRMLTFNYERLNDMFWFTNATVSTIDDLLIHEFGHEMESNHLSARYHDALTLIGAKLKRLARREPDLFEEIERGREL